MSEVEIYTVPVCCYCRRAKRILRKKSASFSEINLLSNPRRHKEMVKRSGGGYTLPQIFINGQPVGGCAELIALERAGRLEELLGME